MKKLFLASLVVTTLEACSNIPDRVDPNYVIFLEAQKSMAAMQVSQQPRNITPTPIFELVAKDGESIELSGVKSIRVYNPSPTTDQKNDPINYKVQAYVPPKSAFAENVDSLTTGVAKIVNNPVTQILAGGKALKDHAEAVGNAANHGYQFVQAPATPQPNMVISGTGVIGGGQLSMVEGDALIGSGTFSPSTNTLANSVLGAGSYDAPILSGTGAVDGSYATNANPSTTTTNTNYDNDVTN